MAGQARVNFDAWVQVLVDETEAVVADGTTLEEKIIDVAWERLYRAQEGSGIGIEAENPTIDHNTIGLNLQTEGSVKTAANPAQQMAQEALKVAKSLSNLLNELAGLQNREEIATATGLAELPDMIDRCYALADKWRQGAVVDLQQPRAAYSGWNPESMRKNSGHECRMEP